MDCKSCANQLDDYIMGGLSGEFKTLVANHLSKCTRCAALLRQASQLSGSIADVMASTTSILKLKPEAEGYVMDAMNGGEGLLAQYDMMGLFEKLTFREKIQKVLYGLKQPKESGDYKWAKLQVRRLISPAAAVLVPSLALLLMVALAGMAPQRQTVVNVRIVEDQTIPELEEPIDIPEPEIQPPDPEHIVEPMDNFIPSTSKTTVGPDVDFSPQPAQFDSVAIIRSPVTMRGIFGSRSPGARGSMLGRHGGGPHTEGAVLRALRWLKKHQEEDGRWTGTSGGGGRRNRDRSDDREYRLCAAGVSGPWRNAGLPGIRGNGGRRHSLAGRKPKTRRHLGLARQIRSLRQPRRDIRAGRSLRHDEDSLDSSSGGSRTGCHHQGTESFRRLGLRAKPVKHT